MPKSLLMPEMKPELAKSLYARMLRIRLVEEALAEEYPKQEMKCPVHLYIGQEAIAAGVSECLRKEDSVLSNHRSHGHYLAKGGALPTFFAELYGRVGGSSSGKGGSMHLLDLEAGFLGSSAIVGGNIPMAAGLALAYKTRGEKRIAVAYLGDGAAEEGVLYETLNFAALKKLPLLLVCENNHYSVLTRLEERQPLNNIHQRAETFGVRASLVDGNDVGAVYSAAASACESIRAGEGPQFLEARTYRWRTHCGPQWDSAQKNRTAEELAAWMKLCPLETFEAKMRDLGIAPDFFTEEKEKLERAIAEAFAFAKGSPYPPASALGENIYA